MQVQVNAIISLVKYFATFCNCPSKEQLLYCGAAYSKMREFTLAYTTMELREVNLEEWLLTFGSESLSLRLTSERVKVK
jgi:hypothetical protein